MHDARGDRLISIAAIGGAILLFAGTWLHPMQADPNVPLAAFTEYAADPHWVASHLMQLAGIALMVSALVLLSRAMMGGPADAIAFLAAAGAIASLAVAAALQAVDGIALKSMVNAWAAATGRDQEILFHSAFAVRQIEIGLASMTALLFGFTSSIYAVALLNDSRFPVWLGWLAIAGGIPTAIAGIAIAYTGFSDLAMSINLPSTSVLLCWMIALGLFVWRNPAHQPSRAAGSAAGELPP
jgi:uncharacterized membrane protein (DUF2068 family)